MDAHLIDIARRVYSAGDTVPVDGIWRELRAPGGGRRRMHTCRLSQGDSFPTMPDTEVCRWRLVRVMAALEWQTI